ncbi:sulfurtransferase [Aquimarina intermedia]|nr:sulfurtransferase [Aquimarina intermedia]
MTYRISSVIILSVFVFSCNKQRDKTFPKSELEVSSYASSDHLIEAEELLKVYRQKHLKIIDFRKATAYAEKHIDGALNIWRTDIEDTSYPYKGMMANKEKLEALFRKLGIKNDDLLIVYDDKGSADASRLWWVLKNYNFESVRILNGGLKAWETIEGAMNDKLVPIISSEFILPVMSSLDLLIEKDEMIEMVNSNRKKIILDTRSQDEFTGKRQKNGAARAGRIPNSVLIDWAEAIEYEGTQKFKTYNELEKIYNRLGASKNDLIISYCHSGVRSAHTTFVLTELLGYNNVKNYDGSWVEWSYFKNLPFEQDSITKLN